MHTVGKRNKFTFILLSNFKLGKGSSPQIHPVAKVNTGTQNHNKSYVQLTKIRLSSYTRIECNNAPNIKYYDLRSHCRNAIHFAKKSWKKLSLCQISGWFTKIV